MDVCFSDPVSVIEQMMRPDFYPHPVNKIEQIQTHTAYVLLTGDYAYKLKKPVNFGFLDYSSLAARKFYSEEELRLNRRTAKELYLAVVPIYRIRDGTLSLSGPGEIVEYALKMRQFPSDSLFSDLLKKGELTFELMGKLAHQVAKFHAGSVVNNKISSFGTVEKIRQAFDENYRQSRPYIGRGQTERHLTQTQAYTDQAFTQWQERFQTRVRHQKIRECHGDLHLHNIVYWQNRVFLFDCIEFNEAFRFVDTMYDIAFTVMDCDAHQRRDLGNAFLNAYLEETGDWDGVGVLPLYLSRQAYVRAKVASFLLDDPAIPSDQKPLLQAKAQAYYTLAWHYTQPRQGQIVLMSGLSGSGKSTVARQLARQTGAIHIRSDAVRKHLAGIPLHQKGDSALYTSVMTQKTYDRLGQLGIELAKLGNTVILDAKYDRHIARQALLSQATKAMI
ncbi:MAG: AAA family ATPase, partial [Cyanobacteria bacterium P01_F01_bin.116]